MIQALLQQGFAHLQAGRFSEAERLLCSILRVEPTHLAANSLMGLLRLQQSRAEEALPFLATSVQRQADPGTLINYGLALDRVGRHQEAAVAFDHALALNPQLFAAHFNHGNALLALGRDAEAVAAFDRALALDPGFTGAHFNRAEALRRLEHFPAALAGLEHAAALTPGDPAIANSLGIVLARLGRRDEALAAYGRALAYAPAHVEALHNRAQLLVTLARPQEALADFDRLLALQPDNEEARVSRASLLRMLGWRNEAAAEYGRVLALAPGRTDILLIRAALLYEMRRLREALEVFEALEISSPGDSMAIGGIAAAAGALCDWNRQAAVDDRIDPCILQGSPALPLLDLCAMRDDPALLLKAAQNAVTEWVPSLPPPLWQGKPRAMSRIRITYVAADFRQHALAQLLPELIEHHDRARFEISAVAMGPDDGSAARQRFAAIFDRFLTVPDFNQEKGARLVRELESDIAIDLGGHSADHMLRLFSRRPAPVQVNWLGFPGTIGADFMDYVLADPTVLPFSLQPFFCERIVHLPDCYQPNIHRPIGKAPTRAEAGLPEEGFVFACFNNSWKIRPFMFEVWMRLLLQVPGSVLWLLQVDDEVSANLRAQSARHGVDPARLVFAPKLAPDRHLARHRLADLFLDTLFYNAHTTGSDALWAGLPVLTCQGRSFASRVGASLLRAAGVPELIAASLDDYEALALKLARDSVLLEDFRQRLAINRDRSVLFDTDRFRRGIETAFAHMWEIAQAGDTPRSFAVADLATYA